MHLTKADSANILDLVKMIDAVLGAYIESPYDQIDTLRAKTAEIVDTLESDSHDTGEDYDLGAIRDEQLQSNVYDPLAEYFYD